MKVNNMGNRISLKDCLNDIIVDSLPYNDDIKDIVDSFLNSRDMDRMLDQIVDEVQEHIDFNICEVTK